MTDEQETAAIPNGSVAKLVTSVPSMNWNRAVGGGIRTLLRGSKPVTQARQRTASPVIMEATEENEEGSVATEEAKHSTEDVSSDPSDNEISISVSGIGQADSKTEDVLPSQVLARPVFAVISQNDGADDVSLEIVRSPQPPAPETNQIDESAVQLQSEETIRSQGLADPANYLPMDIATDSGLTEVTRNTEGDAPSLAKAPLPQSYEPSPGPSDDSRVVGHSTNSNKPLVDEGEMDLDTTVEAPKADSVVQNYNRDAVSGKTRLHICNLPRSVAASGLRSLFERYPVEVVEIIHRVQGSTNEAYVDVQGLSAARDAVNTLSGIRLDGSLLLDIKLLVDDTFQSPAETSVVKEQSSLQAPGLTRSVTQSENRNNNTTSCHDVITIEDDDNIESGKISDRNGGNLEGSGKQNAGQRSEEGEIIEIQSDADPMVTDYSNAAQEHKPIDRSKDNHIIEIIDLEDSDTPRSLPKPTNGSMAGPQTLADLTIAELELQVRYFYITKDPNTILDTDLVRCTVCALAGHLAPWCPTHICEHCNAKDDHFSKECQKIARCNRCRGLHSTVYCNHKLKPQHIVLVCDWCLEKGHIEADCELNWRSSGPLWKKPLPTLSVAKTCHNCGGSGHLGNDCPMRQFGKPMGSSMWSESGLPHPYPPITSFVDQPVQQPTGSRKNKHKMPNSKARGASALPSKPITNVTSIASFPPVSKQNPNSKLRGRPARGSIQIKGLATRPESMASISPIGQTSVQYQPPRNVDHPSGYRGPPPPQFQDYPPSNGFPRGRNGDRRYRSRSRSRSPKGWYQAPPPRSAGYGPPPRDYREREDSRHPGLDSWRPGRR